MITRIGHNQINTNIFLAPLSGCSDLSFRLIAREYGARFAFFEMIDANSLIRNHPKTLRMLKIHRKDTPIAAQLLGGDPCLMCDAAYKLLSHISVPFIDINSACPVKKIIKKKAGSYLLKNPQKLEKLVKKMVLSLPIPVTVKIRIGFTKPDKKNIIILAKSCESAGASAIFVHGRTREQSYSGTVDYSVIRGIKKNVSIPVFGSGNILTPQLAKKMFDETGCDGILVGRGSFGNPWIFNDIEHYLNSNKLPEQRNLATKVKTLKKHLSYVEKYNEFKTAGKIGFLRKIAQWYLVDFPQARKMRNQITSVRNYDSLIKLIESLEY